MAIYKEDLDLLKCPCGNSACDEPVYLYSSCHKGAPTLCEYFHGVLIIRCAECDSEIERIYVAKRDS